MPRKPRTVAQDKLVMRVYDLARKTLGDMVVRRQDIDDVVHEIAENCLIRVRERRWHYRPRNFDQFIYKLVWNHLRKRRRRRHVRREYDLAYLLERSQRMPDWSSADRSFDEESIWATCRKFLSTLPRRKRAAFELVRIDGVAHAEAAEHLELSRETIKNYVCEVTRGLRKEFEAQGIVDPVQSASRKSRGRWKKNDAPLAPGFPADLTRSAPHQGNAEGGRLLGAAG